MFVRRIFSFDENSLNSSSSDNTASTSSTWINNTTDPSTTTIDDYSFKSSDTSAPSNYDSHGIYEDHPGLNPGSERVVELQTEIHDTLRDWMANYDEHEIQAAAESVHAESAPPELERVFNQICDKCEDLVLLSNRQVPPEWTMPDLVREVIGYDSMSIPDLRDTFHDLLLHGPNAWSYVDLESMLDLINYVF